MVKRRSRSKRRKSKQRRSRRKVSKKRSSRRRVSKKRNSKRRSSKRRSRRKVSKMKGGHSTILKVKNAIDRIPTPKDLVDLARNVTTQTNTNLSNFKHRVKDQIGLKDDVCSVKDGKFTYGAHERVRYYCPLKKKMMTKSPNAVKAKHRHVRTMATTPTV